MSDRSAPTVEIGYVKQILHLPANRPALNPTGPETFPSVVVLPRAHQRAFVPAALALSNEGFGVGLEDVEAALEHPGANGPDHRNHAWFCTTEEKPYDVVVTAILTAAAVHKPGTLRSDGNWSNWTTSVALYEKAVRPLVPDQKSALELDIEAMGTEGYNQLAKSGNQREPALR